MTVKRFVEFWKRQGFVLRVRTVHGELCWVFTNSQYSFWLELRHAAAVAKHVWA